MKDIIIVGGCFAGVSTAVKLSNIGVNVTLINHYSYHCLITLLHLLVLWRREYRELSLPLQQILPQPVQFLRGRVNKIIPQKNSIELQTRQGRQCHT